VPVEGPDWQPTFDAVHNVPGESGQRFSIDAFTEQLQYINKRNAAEIAVALGAVDTGDDFEPYIWMADWATQLSPAMNSTPAYVGDQQDMVTAPRSGLACWGDNTIGVTDILDPFLIFGGGYVRVNCLPVIFPQCNSGVSTGTIYYTPIVVDRIGELGSLRWIGGADLSVFSIDRYEVALCGYNPSNGNIERIWSSGDIKSTDANVSGGQVEIEMPMGLTGTTTPGQILFFAHQQIAPGGGQAPRSIAAVPQGGVGRPSTMLLDAACYRKTGASAGIPSSVSLASLTRENRFIPWAAVTVST
jgi:hypothetical protein